MHFGMALGLSYPFLKHIIEQRNRDRHDECMRAMLFAWLQQGDHVSEKRFDSWRTLAGALKQMGDDRAAEEIVHVSGTHHNYNAETEFTCMQCMLIFFLFICFRK